MRHIDFIPFDEWAKEIAQIALQEMTARKLRDTQLDLANQIAQGRFHAQIEAVSGTDEPRAKLPKRALTNQIAGQMFANLQI